MTKIEAVMIFQSEEMPEIIRQYRSSEKWFFYVHKAQESWESFKATLHENKRISSKQAKTWVCPVVL